MPPVLLEPPLELLEEVLLDALLLEDEEELPVLPKLDEPPDDELPDEELDELEEDELLPDDPPVEPG